MLSLTIVVLLTSDLFFIDDKATLDVPVSEDPVLRFDNSATGIRRLLRHMKRAGVTNAVCESTGGYERLEEEYKELLKRSASLSETVELYQTVPGVGHLTATTLLAYLPELGRRDGRALTSLAGLAPWSRDSG